MPSWTGPWTDSFQAIWKKVQADRLPLRTAAFVLALERVTQVRCCYCCAVHLM